MVEIQRSTLEEPGVKKVDACVNGIHLPSLFVQ